MRELLEAHRAAILGRWRTAILAPYPSSGAAFFADERDSFHNPVGATVRTASEAILDVLISAGPCDAALEPLRGLVELRAVQELSASRALAFLPQLKRIVRDELGADVAPEELEGLTARLDDLLLEAFDLFVACRERIYELRTREARARVWTLLQQAELVTEERITTSARKGPHEGRS